LWGSPERDFEGKGKVTRKPIYAGKKVGWKMKGAEK